MQGRGGGRGRGEEGHVWEKREHIDVVSHLGIHL